jgi:WD40 repeat protein
MLGERFTVAPGPGDQVWSVENSDDKPNFRRLWQLSPSLREWTLPAGDYPGVKELGQKLYKKAYYEDFEGQIESVPSRFAFSPDGTKLLLAMDIKAKRKDGSTFIYEKAFVVVWDLQEQKPLTLGLRIDDELLSEWQEYPKVSPDSRHTVLIEMSGKKYVYPGASGQHVITLRDLASGEKVAAFGSRWTDQVEFSPDSLFLLGIMNEKTAKDYLKEAAGAAALYELPAGREVQSWKTEPESWGAAAVGPGGKLVASGGEDRMIHVWDVQSGRELASWPAHDGAVTALAFSKDGATLYSGSSDGVLKLWNLPYIRKELAALGLDW